MYLSPGTCSAVTGLLAVQLVPPPWHCPGRRHPLSWSVPAQVDEGGSQGPPPPLAHKEIFADINRFIDGTEYGSSMSVDISLIEWLAPVFGSQMLAASGSSPFGRPAPVLGPAPVSRVPGTGTCCCPPVAKGVRCPGGPALLLGQSPPTRVCWSGVLHPVLPASAGRRRQGLWEGACGGLLPWRCR